MSETQTQTQMLDLEGTFVPFEDIVEEETKVKDSLLLYPDDFAQTKEVEAYRTSLKEAVEFNPSEVYASVQEGFEPYDIFNGSIKVNNLADCLKNENKERMSACALKAEVAQMANMIECAQVAFKAWLIHNVNAKTAQEKEAAAAYISQESVMWSKQLRVLDTAVYSLIEQKDMSIKMILAVLNSQSYGQHIK